MNMTIYQNDVMISSLSIRIFEGKHIVTLFEEELEEEQYIDERTKKISYKAGVIKGEIGKELKEAINKIYTEIEKIYSVEIKMSLRLLEEELYIEHFYSPSTGFESTVMEKRSSIYREHIRGTDGKVFGLLMEIIAAFVDDYKRRLREAVTKLLHYVAKRFGEERGAFVLRYEEVALLFDVYYEDLSKKRREEKSLYLLSRGVPILIEGSGIAVLDKEVAFALIDYFKKHCEPHKILLFLL